MAEHVSLSSPKSPHRRHTYSGQAGPKRDSMPRMLKPAAIILYVSTSKSNTPSPKLPTKQGDMAMNYEMYLEALGA